MKALLFIACENGHVDIVKMLINQDNCMIDVLDVEGNSLLHATCGNLVGTMICLSYTRVGVMVFNATFNNISLISWRSFLLMEETGENH